MSGQGRVAAGAIAGATVVALVCIGFTGGLAPKPAQTSAVPGDIPVVMTANPGVTTTSALVVPVATALTTTTTATVTSTSTTTTTQSQASHSAAPPSTHSVVTVAPTTASPTHTAPKPPTSSTATTTCQYLIC